MARPRSNDPTHAVTLRLRSSTMVAVERHAATQGVTAREWLQQAVIERLQRAGTTWPPDLNVKENQFSTNEIRQAYGVDPHEPRDGTIG